MMNLKNFDLIYAQALEIAAQTKLLTLCSQMVSPEILDLSVSAADHQELLQKMFKENFPTSLREINERAGLGYSCKYLFEILHKYPFLAVSCAKQLEVLLITLKKGGLNDVPDLESFVGQSLQL